MAGTHEISDSLMQNRTTAEHVFERIKREIVVGRLKPGQRLVERELTERYGVSRTPVREALKQLVRIQLAVNIPYRGITVRQLSYEFARNLYDLRLGIEGLAAYLAAQRSTPAERATLERLFGQIAELSHQGERDDVMLLNNDFHRAIAQATHNRLLIAQVDDLWTSVNLVRASAWQGNARTDGSRQEHEKMLHAILRRDPEEARRSTEHHIRNSWMVVEKALNRMLKKTDEETAMNQAHTR